MHITHNSTTTSTSETHTANMDPSTTNKTGFFKLSPELRNIIYEHFAHEVAPHISISLFQYPNREAEIKHSPSELNLLRASNEVRQEAIGVLYSKVQPTMQLTKPDPKCDFDRVEWIKDVLYGCDNLVQSFSDHLKLFKSLTVEGYHILEVFSLEAKAVELGLQNAAAVRVLAGLKSVETLRIHDARFRTARLLVLDDEPLLGFHVRTRRIYDLMMRVMPKLRTIVCDSGVEEQICRVEPEGGTWRIVCVESGLAMEMENWE